MLSDSVLIAIVAAVPGVVGSVLSFLNRGKLSEVKGAVNGRLTELLELTRSHYYDKGREEVGGEPCPEPPEIQQRRRELELEYDRRAHRAPQRHYRNIHRVK